MYRDGAPNFKLTHLRVLNRKQDHESHRTGEDVRDGYFFRQVKRVSKRSYVSHER